MIDDSITYDDYGRMDYHPEYHFNHRKPWTREDQQYLIDWHTKISNMEMGLALGRTEKTITSALVALRREGRIKESTLKGRRKHL